MPVETRDMKLLGERTQSAMKSLIMNCLESQSYFQNIESLRDHFLEEHCTVKICCGRQVGHTTAAIQTASQLFKNVAFVSPNVHRQNYAKNLIQDSLKNTPDKILFYTIASFQKEALGRSIEAVFVDGASTLSTFSSKQIYEVCERLRRTNGEANPFILVFIQ